MARLVVHPLVRPAPNLLDDRLHHGNLVTALVLERLERLARGFAPDLVVKDGSGDDEGLGVLAWGERKRGEASGGKA